MSTITNLKSLKLGVPVLILLFLIILPRTMLFQSNPEDLSIGILMDLLISIPVLYFLIIRKSAIPKFTIVYPFLLGLLVASFILPAENQKLLSSIKVVAIPIIEFGIVSMIVYKIRKLSTSLKGRSEDDFYDRLLISCTEVLPNRVGKILATEIAVLYYLFAPARKEAIGKLEFTYFKKSGIKTIVGAFLFLIAIETVVVHILVEGWNTKVAWVLSFMGVYTMIQILAILRSMDKRLITIDPEAKRLGLRYGFGCQTSISIDSIERIEKSKKNITDDKSHVSLSLFDLIDSSNVIIYLKEENTLQKIYGISKSYKSITLFIDDRDMFVEEVESLL